MKTTPDLLGCMAVFIEVTDAGSFSAAARRLELSQPSVSRQINTLESVLGVRLLQRTTRRISLTEAGEIYYRRCREIQRQVLEAGNSVSAFRESPSGLLRIGLPIGWTEIRIVPWLSEFLAAYPDIELDIQSTDDIQDVVENRLDMVLRVGARPDSRYVVQSMGKIELVLCATPEYLAQYGEPKTPDDLLQHRCIAFNGFGQWRCDDGKNLQTINVSGPVKTNMVVVMISMALQHMGITLLPVQLLHEHLQKRHLKALMQNYRIKYTQIEVNEVFVLYSNRKHLPAKVRAFIEFYKKKLLEVSNY